MPRRDIDFGIVFGGLMSGQLIAERAAALFRENMDGARYYLPDRLGEIMRDPQYGQTTDLDCPAGRLLDLYWRVFGPRDSVVIFCLHDLPLVECFLSAKLNNSLDEFTEEDLEMFAQVSWQKPIHTAVRNAQARKLIPIADLLIRNPPDLNRDIAEVKKRVSAYDFNADLNEVLDKVEAGLAAGGDKYDQAAMLKHLRTFYEKLNEQVALKLRAQKVPLSVDATDLTKCQQTIDYLERHGVLTDKMKALGRSLYGVLSEEGVHSLRADPEYVRFCRNWIAEYALVLFFELDLRLREFRGTQ
jgi:hypothetical protein